MAIQSFADEATETFFKTGRIKKGTGWSAIRSIAARKLDMLHYAAVLSDLRSSPGNRLEALKGELGGHYSIRINDQWRIVFKWTEAGPIEVRVGDYH